MSSNEELSSQMHPRIEELIQYLATQRRRVHEAVASVFSGKVPKTPDLG